MIANYRNLRHRDDLMQGQLQRLKLRSELEEIYKRANIRRWNELEPSYEVPKMVSKPKEFETKFDVRERLVKKLQPFMINNNEVISFTEYLEDTNKLDELDDLFDQFKKDYIKGARRLTATRIRTLFEDFTRSKKGFDPRQILRIADIPPPEVEVVSRDIQPQSALSAMRIEEPEDIVQEEPEEEKQEVLVAADEGRDLIFLDTQKGGPGGISLKDLKAAVENTPDLQLAKVQMKNKGVLLTAVRAEGFVAYDPESEVFVKGVSGQGMRRGMSRGICWQGYQRVPGTLPYTKGSCKMIGTGMVRGMGYKSISNIPSKKRQQMFDAMVRTGWS